MSTLTIARKSLVLAVSALLSPAAFAQQEMGATPAPSPSPSQETANTVTMSDGETLETVTVRGEHIPDPMVRTAEISSFISAADLVRQGDDSAAAALTRVTGLSLAQGKFVYVRGLGERYSSALLNGSPLPSPEPLQRVVPLNLFPNNVLSSVMVQKTYSARYPGEFGGGLIDLQTLAVPDQPFFSFTSSLGGNTETTFKDANTYRGGDLDFLGFDDNSREMPAALRSAIATGQRVDASSFTPAQLQTIGRSFVNAPMNLMQSTDSLQPDFSAGITGGGKLDLSWGSLGAVGVVGFDNGWQTRSGRQQEGIVLNGTIFPRTDYAFRSTQNDAVLNSLFGMGAQWGDHRINWTNLYIHSTTKEARTRAGNDELAGAQVRDDFTEWFERELFDTQLHGEHEFGSLQIDWRGSYAKTSREAPYEKGIRYRLVDDEYLHNASQEQNYTRFSELSDEVLSAGIDFAYSLPAGDRQDTVISAGASWMDNDRESQSREFRLLALDSALPLDVQRERVDYLLSDVNIGPGLLTLRETTGADGAAAYDGKLTVSGVYTQLDAEFIPHLRTSLGVRYEDAEETVTPRNLFAGPTPVSAPPLENSYLLPSATVTWNFYEDMQLRIGASKTIGRPQFRELAPQSYLDPDSDRLFIGNPFLVDTELVNVDARYEWYFGEGEFLTGGVFYKKLDNPIESIVNEAGATVQQTYINAPQAQLYGAEVEIKKYLALDLASEWWGGSRLFVAANYTYSDSEVKVSPGDVVFPLSSAGVPREAADYIRDGSALQGQSKHLANLQLGIESEASDTQVTLLTTHVGERISARGRPQQPDIVQYPGTIVDLVIRQGFAAFDQDFTLGIEARNLLGEDFEEFQELGGGRVDVNTYDLGVSYSVSLSARF
jgi:outer membrane receptor protein involved in Fe transport